MWNIMPEILEYAEKIGLEPIATGGNCDYIFRDLGDNRHLVLGSAEGGGECPDTLDEPSFVAIYFAESWEQGVCFSFPTARDAMDFMAATVVEVVNIEVEDGLIKGLYS